MSATHDRSAWFEDARFGLFIHWNACAALEGRFAGEPVRQTEYGEWLRARNRVPRKDWDEAIKKLHVTPDIVEGWAESARQAGMRYVIFVSKHHDGLAYWPSEFSDYTLNKLAHVDFDIVDTLKKACDARGLKLGFYYSHWHDWEHPFGWGNFWDLNSNDPSQFEGYNDFFFWGGEGYRDNLTVEQFDEYWRQKSMAQVQELIRRYHPALFWFDCWRRRSDTNMTQKQVEDMLEMIRREDPAIIVNSRLDITSIDGDSGVDYETLGDNEFPHLRIGHPWESAVTFALSWGFSRDDQNWRPATYFIRNLVRNISLGGNLVINFGPMADGRPPSEALTCMTSIGKCLNTNGEGFYGCGYTPFEEHTQDWGLTTVDEKQNALYLHVFDWPVDGIIRVNGLKTVVSSVTQCYECTPLTFTQQGQSVHIHGPLSMPVAYDTVIRLNLSGQIDVDNLAIGELNGGGIALQAARAQVKDVAKEKPFEDSTKLEWQLGDWQNPESSATWTVCIPSAGHWSVKACYACRKDVAGQSFSVINETGSIITQTTRTTQLNWSEFRPFEVGLLHFDQPGMHRITVHPCNRVDTELFKLLWLFLEPTC
jgi:alpha-L-fucosidase